jgi:hypothetical protein
LQPTHTLQVCVTVLRRHLGAHGACAPSPLAGEGRDGGETVEIEATPAFAPTLTLPRRGGGEAVEPSAQDWTEQYLGRSRVGKAQPRGRGAR